MVHVRIEAEEWMNADPDIRARIIHMVKEKNIDIEGLIELDELVQEDERYNQFYGEEEQE